MQIIKAYKCIVVANGIFPENPLLLNILRQAETVIACDGAATSLIIERIIPTAILGDMDSLPEEVATQYHDRIFLNEDQETNDLTKAIHFAKKEGHTEVLILGATGLREDHTLANISLLMDYALLFEQIEMASDYGLFTPILKTTTFPCKPGQQVSFFSMQPGGLVTTHQLRYPLRDKNLTAWWQGSLNETLDTEFTLTLSSGTKMMVYRLFD